MSDAGVSSERKQKTPEEKAKWAAYIRGYRARKKLASGARLELERVMVTETAEPQSSPVAPHLGPHGYPAD